MNTHKGANEMIEELRQFIRHPSSIPIKFKLRGRERTEPLKDVGKGGLCFKASQFIAAGETIQIQISACQPVFAAEGIVRWCRQEGQQFLVGVVFKDSVRFALRMVEQICYIENYRYQVLASTGVALSSEQAASEWIRKYAARFPLKPD
ncbi:PilZ domain-containing protein [Methylophaga sp. OBS4]|uniref:PilZ domain-containing protein n=1 Tax=Methylophaga sp. OBS4 TaxID=2991935 RepID=UPI002256E853|nr:PilZ domain-containing protein [Methylophaga sp. OBS4]MCX4188246.1 PilZ domain-containing protein [Methylophaga sp. OBS4]